MNIGDKVRFLNDVGGGIISGFQGKDTVLVQDEDGFDMPVLRSECIVVQTDSYNLEMTAEEALQAEIVADSNKEEALESPVLETPEGEVLNIYLAFVPRDIKSISTSSFDAYLVNDSNYFVYYTYSNQVSDEAWSCRSHDLIAPNTKLYLETFTKSILNELETLRVQLISFKHDRNYKPKQPIDVELSLDTVKFYKLHSFKENDFFEEKALLYDIVVNDYTKDAIRIDPQELKEALLAKPEFQVRKSAPIRKKKSNKTDVVEVDLHIHELLDDTRGLDNKAILECQLAEFHRVMKAHLGQKKQRIVFIHGKGEGVLRKAIIQELKKTYKSCTYQDASFQEYGFGATMVSIR